MSSFPAHQVRTALVTGAASGIGAAQVSRLRARGVRVVAADLNPQIEAVYAADGDVITVAADLSREHAAAEVVESAERELGSIDYLFHSVGIMPGGTIADTSAAQTLRVMDVNYGSMVRVVEAVLPGMRARRRGHMVIMGSLTGYVPTKGFAAYSASKAATNFFVETLAREERSAGIQVLLVAPGAVKTPLLAQAADGPPAIARLADKKSSLMMTSTDAVLDSVEKGLAEERSVVTPGGVAPALVRRLSPRLMWRLSSVLG